MAWREKTLTLLGNGCLRFVTHFCSWYKKCLKSASMRVSSKVPVFYLQRQPFRCVQQRMLHVWSLCPSYGKNLLNIKPYNLKHVACIVEYNKTLVLEGKIYVNIDLFVMNFIKIAYCMCRCLSIYHATVHEGLCLLTQTKVGGTE
jgi:hypothetical protein